MRNADRRIIFVIRYLADQSLTDTTGSDYAGDPGQARCSDDDIDYLCDAVNRCFDLGIRPENVAWSYADVRPLLGDEAGDAASVSSDCRLDLEATVGLGPLLTVVGGKITTYRKLAE